MSPVYQHLTSTAAILSVAGVLVLGYLTGVDSHGMMLDPVNRASLWRYDPTAPKDYNDNEGFCGGFYNQWSLNDGNCGLCGDNYRDQTPRAHENGGIYGNGYIVRKYIAGEIAEISVKITQNHRGYFLFHLCNIDLSPESEECFSSEPLQLSGGDYKYYLPSYSNGIFNTSVIIPSDVLCDHCVLRWTYMTENSWGICDDGSGALGCGPQEQFKGCADISIFPPQYSMYNAIPHY